MLEPAWLGGCETSAPWWVRWRWLSRQIAKRRRWQTDGLTDGVKVALRFSGVNFVSLDFTDYVGMALCMGDNRVGDTSDLLDLPQEVGLGRRGSF